jgi:hypothetical protein
MIRHSKSLTGARGQNTTIWLITGNLPPPPPAENLPPPGADEPCYLGGLDCDDYNSSIFPDCNKFMCASPTRFYRVHSNHKIEEQNQAQ